MLRKWFVLSGVAFVLLTISTVPTMRVSANAATAFAQPAKEEPASETTGSIMLNGQKIDYTCIAGRLPVTDMTGKAKGSIFFMAYTRKDAGNLDRRPLTFSYNGGPGSSSSYVHMGAFGPQRVLIDDDGKTIPKPYKLVDNDCSILDVTDVVFIDPVGTGYSRPDDAKEGKMFWGLEEDTTSVGDFIRAYVAKYKREKSPTFLAGESYGTTRSATLSKYLQEKGGVNLVGVALISMVLDFRTITFTQNESIAYVVTLPTYTAAALHHQKIKGDQAKLLAEAVKFAEGPYAAALNKGKDLTDEAKNEMAKQVAKWTGLSEEYVLKVNLRINAGAFRGELLREAQQNIGRYDARVAAKAAGGGKGGKGGGGGGDPSNSLTSPAFTELMNSYLKQDLKVKTDLSYAISGKVNPWSYGVPRGKANVVPRLRSAMEKDKTFRVFVACGYCDLATPWYAAKWTMDQFDNADLQKRITLGYYDGGHMMYTVRESHKRLRQDMLKFINGGERAMPAIKPAGRLDVGGGEPFLGVELIWMQDSSRIAACCD